MPEIIHKELSYIVNGCIFDVHNEVGPGLREECYQKAMEIRLAHAGLSFVSKPRTRSELVYLAKVADIFEPDFLVADRLALELKVQREGLTTANFRQTVNYVKHWKLSLGLLVNFADAQAVIQRVVFHEESSEPEEDYEAIRELVPADLRPILATVREMILSVHREFGLGYGDTTYRKLLEIAISHQGLNCRPDTTVHPVFRDQPLPLSPISPLVVNDAILVEVEAIHDGITARAIRTMQTHLEVTGAAFGIVVSFGQRKFQIRGVRPPRPSHSRSP